MIESINSLKKRQTQTTVRANPTHTPKPMRKRREPLSSMEVQLFTGNIQTNLEIPELTNTHS